jgi:hypothetical protein
MPPRPPGHCDGSRRASVTGYVRIREGAVRVVGDDLDLSAWHHVGGCLPCVMYDHGLVGSDREVFDDLLSLWMLWPRADQKWTALAAACADAARRVTRV